MHPKNKSLIRMLLLPLWLILPPAPVKTRSQLTKKIAGWRQQKLSTSSIAHLVARFLLSCILADIIRSWSREYIRSQM